jgi:hypothetical protein
MRDGPVLKQAIRYVGIELLTRERLRVSRRKSSHYLVLNYSQDRLQRRFMFAIS